VERYNIWGRWGLVQQ